MSSKMMKLMAGRKAQFYIVIALILIVTLFTIQPPVVQTREPADSFVLLYENFMSESGRVINSGIYDGNLTARFRNFSDTYLEYSLAQAQDFRFAYALRDRDSITIANRLNEQLNVTAPGISVLVDSNRDLAINQTQNITFYIGGRGYDIAFTRDPEVKAVFKKTGRKEVLVHVEG